MLASLSDGLQLGGSFALGAILTSAAVPSMRMLAVRTAFYDLPVGYKKHSRATPYLGGAAVIVGFLLAATLFGPAWTRFWAAAGGSVLLLAVGTLDDRVGLGVVPRVAAQVASAVALWLSGISWEIGAPVADLGITVLWVVGVSNAFNLMDNIDGAAATMGLTSALGVAVLAITLDDIGLAAFAFALAGACGGFLPYNLAKPARIFLGDGGSLPIGFLAAALVMACPPQSVGLTGVLAAVPLVGVPIFDTALVVISRYRRGATILSGGRDHVTHRLLGRLGTAHRVVFVLALAQVVLCLLALALHDLDNYGVIEVTVGYLTCAFVALALLEGPMRAGVPRRGERQPA